MAKRGGRKNSEVLSTERDKMKEHCMTKFILSVTHGDRDTNLKFEDWLKDGQVLLDLMTTISPFDVPSAEPFAPVPPNPDVDRLKTAIQSMQNYGVPPMFLFSVEDLYEVKHIPRVVRCLEELEKLAKKEEHINFASINPTKVWAQ